MRSVNEKSKGTGRPKTTRERGYKTKARDWSQYKSVKADRGTYIMVRKDQDAEAEVKSYQKRVSADRYRQLVK